jgi:hypothetical protein
MSMLEMAARSSGEDSDCGSFVFAMAVHLPAADDMDMKFPTQWRKPLGVNPQKARQERCEKGLGRRIGPDAHRRSKMEGLGGLFAAVPPSPAHFLGKRSILASGTIHP